MSSKFLLLCLFGLLALALAVPDAVEEKASDDTADEQEPADIPQSSDEQTEDEPEESDAADEKEDEPEPKELAETDNQDENANDPARRSLRRRWLIFCIYWLRYKKCRHVCVTNVLLWRRRFIRRRRCHRLCCDHLRRIRYVCAICYRYCYRYGRFWKRCYTRCIHRRRG